MRRRSERGGVTVELVVMIPLIAVLIGMVVVGARVWWIRASVEQLASSAARQASISRSAAEAQTSAQQLVASDASSTGVTCTAGLPSLELDVSGFSVPVGQPASVRAVVRCVVPLGDVAVPGVPFTLPVEASATSTLDRLRARE